MKTWISILGLLSLSVTLGCLLKDERALKATEEKLVEADFLIRNVTIHDGSGELPYKGDLAIRGERISAVGTFRVAGKPKEINGERLIVAPGFIDLHTHCDLEPGLTRLDRRVNLNYLFQGVTTVVTGNCGFGRVDVGAVLKKLEDGKIGTNVLHLVPHNDLRQQVMKGNAASQPTKKDLAEMKRITAQGMQDGAWGLSTGLWYVPGSYADRQEIIELAKVAAIYDGLYVTHMRNEEEGLLESIVEALEIGERAGLPVHISHLKRGSLKVRSVTVEAALARIERAREAGRKVTADQYPYTAWSTSMSATVVPPRYLRGTPKEIADRLAENKPELLKAVKTLIVEWDAETSLHIARYARRPEWQGKTLGQIANKEKRPAEEIALEIVRNGDASVVGYTMSEKDVEFIMKQPYVATASDGSAQLITEDTVPHPRSYGTFPRKIGEYALAKKIVPLEQALRSCTGLPADILRLPERGYLKAGYFADVVVFDPKTFREKASYEKPHRYAEGVRYLFVNGVLTISAGTYTDALAGKAIRHKSMPRGD